MRLRMKTIIGNALIVSPPAGALFSTVSRANAQTAKAAYVGSAACAKCHVKAYEGWKHTRMANVVRSPKEHPEAVLGDFTHPDPVRSFNLDQVAFTYGSRW